MTSRDVFRIAAVIFFIGLVLVAIVRPSPPATASPQPGRATITRSGERDQVTDKFTLTGDYRLDWTATDTGNKSVGCFHSADLEPRAASISGTPDGGGRKTGTTRAYGLSGQYYFQVISGCAWTLTLVPE